MKISRKGAISSISKGFTLIELLIVVAIIAILATVIITNVAGARQKATNSKVLADLKSASDAVAQCVAADGTVYSTGTTALTSVGAIPVAGQRICSSADVTAVWPTISGKSTSGGTWGMRTASYANASNYTVTASSGTTGADPAVFCSQNGCQKKWGNANNAGGPIATW